MALKGTQISVGTSPTPLSTAPVATDPSPGSSVTVKLKSTASQSVFLGDSGVTTSGYELEPGESVSVDLEFGETLYGVVASGSVTAHCLGQGL